MGRKRIAELHSPREFSEKYPLTFQSEDIVRKGREDIIKILNSEDKRFLLIIGPCSIDDYDAAIEYARKLKKISNEVSDKIVIVMRAYFEKPRTTVGWKGALYSSYDGSVVGLEKGIGFSRKVLAGLTEVGLPCATELLSPVLLDYCGDLISYGCAGARSSECQPTREIGSEDFVPFGFKNNTDGNVEVAIDALVASREPHIRFGTSFDGRAAQIQTYGNKNANLILRGGKDGPNYGKEHIDLYLEKLKERKVLPSIIVDCSHSNSNKDFAMQPKVALDVLNQRKNNSHIVGLMLESYLEPGRGEKYGQSRTDPCMGFEMTENLIRKIYGEL